MGKTLHNAPVVHYTDSLGFRGLGFRVLVLVHQQQLTSLGLGFIEACGLGLFAKTTLGLGFRICWPFGWLGMKEWILLVVPCNPLW